VSGTSCISLYQVKFQTLRPFRTRAGVASFPCAQLRPQAEQVLYLIQRCCGWKLRVCVRYGTKSPPQKHTHITRFTLKVPDGSIPKYNIHVYIYTKFSMGTGPRREAVSTGSPAIHEPSGTFKIEILTTARGARPHPAT
jgi:hypothetical protein